MRMGGSALRLANHDWRREWERGRGEAVSRAGAQEIMAGLCPLKGSEWWDTDRATRSFPLTIEGQNLMVTCVWEPSLVVKGNVKIHLSGAQTGEFTVQGDYARGGTNVDPALAKILVMLKDLGGKANELPRFDLGNGELKTANQPWDNIADAPPYKKGSANDMPTMERTAHIYEVVVRFSEALDFLINKVLRESGKRPRDLRDKMVNEFRIPVTIDDQAAELVGKLVGRHRPLESIIEVMGEVGVAGGMRIVFNGLEGGTAPNFVEEDVDFPYQDTENVVRQIEVYDRDRVHGGVNNFGATRLYGRQKKDDPRARLQHFLNEGGNMEEVVARLSAMTAYLESLQATFEGEIGVMRRRISRGTSGFKGRLAT